MEMINDINLKKLRENFLLGENEKRRAEIRAKLRELSESDWRDPEVRSKKWQLRKQMWAIPREEIAHTLYCSIISHLRGKLHMTKISREKLSNLIGTQNFRKWTLREKDDGTKKRQEFTYVWTMKHQQKLIETSIELYGLTNSQDPNY